MNKRSDKQQRRKARRAKGKSRGHPAPPKWYATPIIGRFTWGDAVFVVLLFLAFYLFEHVTGIPIPKSPRNL